MQRVAIYTRVSTTNQVKDGYSLDAQVNTLTQYCQEKGYLIVGHYSDEGISAKDIKHRPAMRRLLADAQNGLLDIVLVWKLTRFTRSLADLVDMCDMLEKHGVTFVSYSESFDCSTPSGRMMRNILGVIAQWEREVISENIRLALEERALQGRPTCTYALGYDIGADGNLMVNEKEAQIVRDIYDSYLRIRSFKGVSEYCQQRGYRGKLGGRLQPESIHKILTRYIYAGFFSWKRIPTKGNFQPIISISAYNRVQEIIDERGNKVGRNRKYGVVFLPEE